MDFKRLLRLREEKELTQAEIAKIFKVSQANYSRWEREKEFIPLRKINLICIYFNVSMDYLIGLTNTNIKYMKTDLNPKKIGQNIKTIRKNNNLSQKDLAFLLNTTQSTISAYESGKTLILTAFALQIVKEFNVSLDWLCNRKKYK